ncbi:MAG: TolC family protein [Saprospiraceae bacterium]
MNLFALNISRLRIHVLILICTVGMHYGSWAVTDSIPFTYQDFIAQVLEQHPVAKQAGLQPGFAAAERLAARGNFDPKLNADLDDKYLGQKHYYQLFEAGFKIPTWYGLTVAGHYENTTGIYLNPENRTDPGGLISLGVEANLLQGLLIDQRRAALQQAAVFTQQAENEQRLILQSLLTDASGAYINWQAAFTNQGIYQEGLDLATQYLVATRQLYFNGDKPAIDTLEAFLLFQDQQMQLLENEIYLNKAQQEMEQYLWYDGIPLELQPDRVPEPVETELFELTPPVVLDDLLARPPDVLAKTYKRSQLQIEQRLKVDKYKPKLKLKYAPLFSVPQGGTPLEYDLDNYKWGVGFSMPLLYRSERGAVQKTRLKIQENEFELEDKQNQLRNKVQANLQKQVLLREQLGLQTENARGYAILLDAEREKFMIGESSVFLLNKRAEKYLSTRIKQTQLTAKVRLSEVEYLYLTGTFMEYLANQ